MVSLIMNTHAKGYRREYQAKLLLMADGWLVDRKNAVRRGSNDFFFLFDLVAVRGNECMFVQVKSSRSASLPAVRSILKWKKETGVSLPCQVWYKENHKEWVVLDA